MSRVQDEQERQNDKLVEAWAALLTTEEGRLIMADLMNRAGIYTTTFTGSSNGMFLEGRRSLGLEVMQAYLVPQGASVHGELLKEAETRMKRLHQAEQQDRQDSDE